MDEGSGKFRPESVVETPYLRAREVWDDRIGSARHQAYTWRLVAFVSLVMVGLMGLALVWRSMSAEVIPYIVEVDAKGDVRLVGTPEAQNWEPGEGVHRFFLRQWIESVREVSSDMSVVRGNLLHAYDGTTSRARNQLDEQVREENPFELFEKQTRQIQITSMVVVGEKDSWRVEWLEIVRDLEGRTASEQPMVGVFELKRRPPETRRELESNPLGLFVEHFSWSRVEGGR